MALEGDSSGLWLFRDRRIAYETLRPLNAILGNVVYMNLYNVYFTSKGTGPRTVQIEALNQSGAKAQVEARYPGAYGVISNQVPSSAKKK
jgi:hypothetical protein